VTSRQFIGRRGRPSISPRVGLFGLIGAGNIGNDGSMEAVLNYLRTDHPEAVIDAMCPGPKIVRNRYGIATTPMIWYQRYEKRVSGVTAFLLKLAGKGIDAFRTASWVRRHDVVIVPGAGVLEASLPVRPWGMPYEMFLLSASGKLFGTKIALVGVGAGAINRRSTRWLSNSAARLAFYRSYRDAGAREALRQRGLDVTQDHVYADLAFAHSVPPAPAADVPIVGVGVMGYYGSNDDRNRADEIYSSYVAGMTHFVEWLVDSGYRVRLLIGDTFGCDDSPVEEISAAVRESRPDLDASWLVAEPVTTFRDLMQTMLPVRSVVAIRFHNILCALMLSKPTISISYSPKHDVLMTDMGLPGSSHPASSLDVDRLIEQFKEMESRSAELRQTLEEHNAANRRLLEHQFAELSAVLFPVAKSASDPEEHEAASAAAH
jgi:polysaccharide pyruvyl transferase WcaK-like protein